jgi:hypothetical protein
MREGQTFPLIGENMNNVLNFPVKEPATVPQTAKASDPVDAMVKESAVMQLVSTLAFYSKCGWDNGEKARAAFPALREILARANVDLQISN